MTLKMFIQFVSLEVSHCNKPILIQVLVSWLPFHILQQSVIHHKRLECYIVDQRQGWNEIHFSGSNIDENDCREGCSDITKNWQWFILDRGSCYCLEHLTTGKNH